MYLLTPDKSNFFLSMYHTSSKILFPLTGTCVSYTFLTKEETKISKTLYSVNMLNIGFHSYVSCSCIISDYIKQVHIERAIRLCNVKSHGLACVGFLWYIWKDT